MKPPAHIICSLTLGTIISLSTRSWQTGAICLAAGVAPDADHIVDFLAQYGWRSFSLKRCYTVCAGTRGDPAPDQLQTVRLFLHSIEAAILLGLIAALTRDQYLVAASIGYAGHLILDTAGNPVTPQFYLLSWRAARKFRARDLFPAGRNS